MQHKVFLTEEIQPEAARRLRAALPIVVGHPGQSLDEVREQVADATIILSKTDPLRIGREIIDAAPRLVHIARHGSGYSNVDVDHATARGISVSYLHWLNTVAIAEYTLGLMLMAARNLVQAVERSRLGAPDRVALMGTELSGKTLGILGPGAIGIEVVRRAHAFGMRVLAYHPRPEGKDFSGLPMTLVPLRTLLSESDFVSIHTPLTPETRGVISTPELAAMKPSAWLLNLGRGGIVDEAALRAALEGGGIAGAVLDVLENEPVSASDPLLSCPGCIVLPHIAAMTVETQDRIAMAVVDDVCAVARGERPAHLANPSAWRGAR